MEEESLDKHLGRQWPGGAAPRLLIQARPRWPLRGTDGAAVAHSRLLLPGTDWVPWPPGRQRENLLLLFSQLARVSANRAPPSQAATLLSCYDPVSLRGQGKG